MGIITDTGYCRWDYEILHWNLSQFVMCSNFSHQNCLSIGHQIGRELLKMKSKDISNPSLLSCWKSLRFTLREVQMLLDEAKIIVNIQWLDFHRSWITIFLLFPGALVPLKVYVSLMKANLVSPDIFLFQIILHMKNSMQCKANIHR